MSISCGEYLLRLRGWHVGIVAGYLIGVAVETKLRDGW
jgi:hypothetical protein